MDWRLLLALSTLLIILAVYVWRSQPSNTLNRCFAIQTLTIALWVIGIGGTHSAAVPEFWGRWTFAAASLMPCMCLTFAREFPGPKPWPSRLVVASALGIGVTLALTSVVSPWIAFDFVILPSGTLRRKPGPL